MAEKETTAEDRAEGIIIYCCKAVKPSTQNKEATAVVKEIMGKVEKELVVHPHHRSMLINDPIHGNIKLNSLERAIINTQEFFRLKDINQLGVKRHVFPGATHTRFEHSIGVCHLAGEMVHHLKRKQQEITGGIKICPKDEFCVRLAGLCHDLGHGPFSHFFEDVIKEVMNDKGKNHETMSKLIFKKILLDNSKVLATLVSSPYELDQSHVKLIEDMIVPPEGLQGINGERKWLYEIVANKKSGMDVDKWDYFARDFRHLGVTNEFDLRRCMQLSTIVDVDGEYHIGFRDKEMTNIYGMFRTRSILHIKALKHQTVVGLEMMLKDIFIFIKEVKMINIPGSERMSLIDVLERAYSSPQADLSGYIALSDSILHLIMFAEPVEPTENLIKAQELIQKLKERKLYRCIVDRSLELNDKDEVTKMQRKKMEDYPEENLKKRVKYNCFKYASEEALDPIEMIHFFKKPVDDRKLPDGISHKKLPPVSILCKPEGLREHRIRLYDTSGEFREDDKDKAVKSFEDWWKLSKFPVLRYAPDSAQEERSHSL